MVQSYLSNSELSGELSELMAINFPTFYRLNNISQVLHSLANSMDAKGVTQISTTAKYCAQLIFLCVLFVFCTEVR